MRARWVDAVLVLVSWAVVAVPAVMLVSGRTHFIERWLIAATVLPLLGLLLRHFRLSARLERNANSRDCGGTEIALAEELAGVGRWCIELETGCHRWSEGMCHILGLPQEIRPTQALLAELLPEGLAQLEIMLASHREDREAFHIEFGFESPKLGTRILHARACNVFGPGGIREQLFMVVRDVTETYLRVARAEEASHAARREADEALRMAHTDQLTGLANRRSAMAALDRAIVAARTAGEPLGLLVLDVDHFKAINDTHGHAVGDSVLAEVGRIAMRCVRQEQLAARVGGEEFMIILPGASSHATAGAAERLRLAIEVGTASAAIPQVTVSIGQAMLEPYDTSLLLFARADDALYEAKRNGRNRIARAA
ncbi:MAG: sensor domain-containing diguanylate cyclase [Erythrobacter sp.]|jgi:diguanylate cyclase (GGDEF)-like protein